MGLKTMKMPLFPVMLWLGPLREKNRLALLRRGTNLSEFRARSQVRQQRVGIDRRIRTISARDRLPEQRTCGFGLPAVGKMRRRKVIYFRIRRRFYAASQSRDVSARPMIETRRECGVSAPERDVLLQNGERLGRLALAQKNINRNSPRDVGGRIKVQIIERSRIIASQHESHSAGARARIMRIDQHRRVAFARRFIEQA